MRLPKRGFHNHFANDFAVINLGRIQKAIDEGKLKGKETVTAADLHQAGLVSHGQDGVRLLAKGELKTKLNFEVAGASRSAIAAVEKAGGSVKTTFKKTIHMNKKGQPGKRVQRRKAAADKRDKAKAG
jgi:large subunit ribosomal protein L15